MAESERHEANSAAAGNVVIPPEKWSSFFSSFSRQHQGAVITVAVTMGDEQLTETRNARFDEVRSGTAGSRGHIALSLSRAQGGHHTYEVRRPLKVVLYRDPDGTDKGIDIFSSDGTLTSVRLSAPAVAEKKIGHRAA